MFTEQQVIDAFKGRIHCSQIVLAEAAEEHGYDRGEAMRMASPFGGGMFRGDTCGAVLGALLAIGMKYGNCELGNTEQDKECIKKVKEFQEKFTERYGSTICRELIGFDFADPEQAREAVESGRVYKICPGLVLGAIKILGEL